MKYRAKWWFSCEVSYIFRNILQVMRAKLNYCWDVAVKTILKTIILLQLCVLQTYNYYFLIIIVFLLHEHYHVNGARSLNIRTPYFSHSTAWIHNSWAVSKQDIIAAPFQATIAESISLGLVMMSNCSKNWQQKIEGSPRRYLHRLANAQIILL